MDHKFNLNPIDSIFQGPIDLLKGEHCVILQRLEMIERTLQYLGSLPDETALQRCKIEQSRLRTWVDELTQQVVLHFLIEEEALFPVLADYIGRENGLIEVMLQEHERIRSALSEWKSAVNTLCQGMVSAREALLKVVIGLGHRSIALLRLHMSKEDQILFKICEVSLSEKEKTQVAQKIRAIVSH